MNWISVKDRLPKEKEPVLIVDTNDGAMITAYLYIGYDRRSKEWHWAGEDGWDLKQSPWTHWIYVKDIPKPEISNV